MHEYMFPRFLFAEDDGGGSGEPQSGSDDGDTEDNEGEPQGGKNADWYEAQLKKTRAEAAKYRTQNKDLSAKVEEFEGASKSDLEKLTEKATTAEQRAAQAEARAMRLEVAADKGLTKAQAARLQGSTLEEIEADADELLELFGQPKPSGNGRMAENLRQSGAGEELPEETDPRKLAALHSRR